MGWRIPFLGHKDNEVAEFTDVLLRGTTDIRGTVKIDEVAITATPADLNLISGLAAGAITSGMVKVFEKEITCALGTAKTGTVVTLPLGALILNIMTHCTEALDGDTTTTFEVGILGNTDKYVDPVDCPVTLDGVIEMFGGTNNDQKLPEVMTAETAIIYTYTNTAKATAGKVKVRVVYV